jgi:Ca2+-binding RTX toxin-like protein
MSWLSAGVTLPGALVPEDHAFVSFEVVPTASGVTLIAVTSPGAGGGVVSFELRPGQLPLAFDHNDLTGIGTRLFHSGVSIAMDGTQPILFVSGQGGAGVGGFTVGANGSIGTAVTFTSTDGLITSSPTALTAATFGERTFVFAGEAGGIRVYELQPGRVLNPVAFQGDAPDRYLGSPTEFAIARPGGQPVLLTLSGTEHGIMSHRIDPVTGALTQAGRIGAEEGLGVNGLTRVETVDVGGQTFAVVAGTNSSSLSVLRVAADGGLSVTDHVIDTLDTRFGSITALDIVQAAGWTFVVAGGGDAGLSLFTLLADGRLVHLQSIADTTGLTLDSVSALAGAVVGSELQIVAASETERGLSVFTLPLANLGQVLSGTGAGATITGGAASDLIQGSAANEVLRGLGGRDVIFDGAGSDTLWGGTGTDVFVLAADGVADTIQDFEPGVDRLDLSAWPMLYDPTQLGYTMTGIGAVLTYRGETLTLISMMGTALTLAQIFPGGILGPNRPPLVLFDAPFRLTGTAGADSMAGGAAGDTIEGLGGNDTLLGLAGNDSLLGGDGADLIEGGDGDDWIDGGAQPDTVLGGAGNDTVTGGLGPDTIWLGDGNDVFHDSAQNDSFGADWIDAGAGNDTIWGDSGRDTILGGDGNDLIHGGRGSNLIDGGTGDDTIHAGDGDDTVHGGTGADWVTLGAGNDIFHDHSEPGAAGADWVDAGEGRDSVYALGGNDTIWGGGGEDLIEGGDGDDWIDGGSERDTIHGGAGNDTVRGGLGPDFVYLNAGDDVFHDEDQGGAFGANWVEGGNGNDTINGGGGNDSLYGGAGNDWINGGSGYDVIHGGAGADTVFGGQGRDRVFLNDGNDVFFDDPQTGIHGRDTVFGGAGNDTIHAGGGDDEFWGEGGADVFVFMPGSGTDRIMDFVPGVDLIVFSGTGLTFESLVLSQSGSDALVDFGVDRIVLAGIDAALLSADHFNFL